MGNVLSHTQEQNKSKPQDLEAHYYTGQGAQAKNISRIMHKKSGFSSDAEVRSFQEAVVASRQGEYQKKIDTLTGEKNTLDTEAAEMRASIGDAELVKDRDSLLAQYEMMRGEKKKWQEKIQEAADKVYNLENDWQRALQARNNQTDEEADEAIAKEQEELAAVMAELAKHNEQVEHYERSRAEMDDDTGLFASTKRTYYAKRAASHSADIEKYTKKYAEQKEKIDGLLAQNAKVQSTRAAYQQAVSEQQDIQEAYKTYKLAFDEFCIQNVQYFAVNADAHEEDRAAEEKTEKYLDAYGKKTEAGFKQAQIDENTQQKEAVEEKVKSADVLDMSKAKYEGTVRAIAVDGEMYYDRTQLGDTGADASQLTSEERVARSSDVEDLIEADEEKIMLEEQKVIGQLENLEVFKYINSDNLMEYMEYDEDKADFVFQLLEQQKLAQSKPAADSTAAESATAAEGTTAAEGATAADSVVTVESAVLEAAQEEAAAEAQRKEAEAKLKVLLKKYGLNDDILFEADFENHPFLSGLKNMAVGIGSGTFNITAFLANAGVGGALGFLGADSFIEAHRQETVGNSEADTNRVYGISNASQVAVMLINAALIEKMKAVGLAMNRNIGELKLADSGLLEKLALFGATDPSLLTGLGNEIALIMNSIKAYDNAVTAEEVKEYGKKMKEKGFTRFGRVMDTASAENRVKELEGITDAAGAVVSTVLALTGVGGLLVTGGSVIIKTVIKKVGAAIIRNGTVKDIIASPEILGGVAYDKNLINEDHFNALFHEVTGVEKPSLLGNILKVVDGIDLHRATRRSALLPNAVTDGAMRQLGFTEPGKYDKIKLKDIYKRTGMTESDWRKVLRNAIEIKGKDYDTNWTKFAKGFTFGLYDYKDKKILSRQDLMKQRREEKFQEKHIFGVDYDTRWSRFVKWLPSNSNYYLYKNGLMPSQTGQTGQTG